MGNFKIEIEAVGGHGALRELKQGEPLAYSRVGEREPDRMAFDFVVALANSGCSVVSAKLIHWPDTTPIIDDLKNATREHGDFTERWQGEDMLKHLNHNLLPEGPLRDIARPFVHLAYTVVRTVPRTAERTVALRKILEGMDAAIRAVAKP